MASQINEFALESQQNAFIPRSLASPSHEQKKIIFSLLNGKSVIVDAVAGSGKTTTILWIAKAFQNKKIVNVNI